MYLSPGSMLVWNGEKSLATVTTNAGEWRHSPQVGERVGEKDDLGGELHNMFDEHPHTFWHSAWGKDAGPKAIKIQFKVRFI